MNITISQMVEDVRKLGLREGDIVLVHSALSAIGHVENGADGVISALLEVLGNTGTLVMSAHSSGIFDVKNSPATVGLIPETFRRREGVLRSFHPTHSMTAFGPSAAELTAGHLECSTACGEGTPYVKLMNWGGKILLLGVDQDRNTSLHALEAMVSAPFLKTVTREYLDPESRDIKTVAIQDYPGPHREFIGLDRFFRDAGIMSIGKVGRAVSRLIDAGEMREVGLRILRKDVTAILCGNPNCQDCVTQRAAVKRHRLKAEDFQLGATSDAAGRSIIEAMDAMAREGMNFIELREVDGHEIADFSAEEARELATRIRGRGFTITAVSARKHRSDWRSLVDAAVAVEAFAAILPISAYSSEIAQFALDKGVALRLENCRETSAECLARFSAISGDGPTLVLNPAYFAAMGEKPFSGIYSKSPLKRLVTQLYVSDGTFLSESTLPAHGNGEIKELISILRCSSFEGPLTIKTTAGHSFARYMEEFWSLLNSL